MVANQATWDDHERYFYGGLKTIFQRKTLNNTSFRSIEQLTQVTHDFTAAYNENAMPFVWRKREVPRRRAS